MPCPKEDGRGNGNPEDRVTGSRPPGEVPGLGQAGKNAADAAPDIPDEVLDPALKKVFGPSIRRQDGSWNEDAYFKKKFPGIFGPDGTSLDPKKAERFPEMIHEWMPDHPREARTVYNELDALRPDLVESPKASPFPEAKVVQMQKDAARVWADYEPKSADARFALGDSSLRGGDYPAAEKNLRFAVENGKADSQTLTAYGGAAYGMKDFAAAAQSAKMALKLDPSNQRALALLRLSEGKVPQVKLPPIGDAFGKAERGEGYLRAVQSGKGERPPFGDGAPLPSGSAEEIARRESIRHIPTPEQRSEELAKLAGSRLAVQDPAGAKEAASRALEEDPGNVRAYGHRAMANNRLGLYEEARKDADEGLRLSPKDTPSLLNRAFAFNRLREYSPALGDSESVLERERRNVFAHLMKAYAHEGLHEREAMMSSLRAAASLSDAYAPMYQKALQVPGSQDALFLFERDLMPASAPAAPRRGRWPLFLLAGAAAAVLACLAYLAGAASAREVQIPPPAAEGVQGIGSRYEVLGKIGSGGMGEVFEGRDLALDRRVAIKKMRGDLGRDASERARFLAEARTTAKLRHPGIVEIYAVLEEEGDAYLVFEHVDGKTLSEMLRERGRIPFAAARDWMRSACEAVEYAHSQGIVHRDIKPSNIMLSGERVKVMDFGVARQAKDAAGRLATGTAAGTPSYMAPEQEQGQVRKESDVFALGVCFYELLTGSLPFEGSGAGMLVNKMGGRHVPLAGRLPAVPAGLEEALARSFHPDPDRRFRSPQDFAAALDSIQA